MYIYKAIVNKVYDGDTIFCDIDLGMGIWNRGCSKWGEKLRLARINTPELKGKEREQGIISRDFLSNKILGKEILLETHKDKKGMYGRWLVEIWLEQQNINDLLVSTGHAKWY